MFAAYIKILLKEKYLDNRARADEDVLRLHVPMDDAIGVQIIQRFYLKKACILWLIEISGTAGTINNSTVIRKKTGKRKSQLVQNSLC